MLKEAIHRSAASARRSRSRAREVLTAQKSGYRLLSHTSAAARIASRSNRRTSAAACAICSIERSSSADSTSAAGTWGEVIR
ncbi:hypothetical protein ACFYWP_18390 [Actinacidiphila glaucinigra]|uniref:hypothetical protein n=1 Tax=Actinacidiphila glaucinigra TaxID=235986 RepID=UPI00367ACA4A